MGCGEGLELVWENFAGGLCKRAVLPGSTDYCQTLKDGERTTSTLNSYSWFSKKQDQQDHSQTISFASPLPSPSERQGFVLFTAQSRAWLIKLRPLGSKSQSSFSLLELRGCECLSWGTILVQCLFWLPLTHPWVKGGSMYATMFCYEDDELNLRTVSYSN